MATAITNSARNSATLHGLDVQELMRISSKNFVSIEDVQAELVKHGMQVPAQLALTTTQPPLVQSDRNTANETPQALRNLSLPQFLRRLLGFFSGSQLQQLYCYQAGVHFCRNANNNLLERTAVLVQKNLENLENLKSAKPAKKQAKPVKALNSGQSVNGRLQVFLQTKRVAVGALRSMLALYKIIALDSAKFLSQQGLAQVLVHCWEGKPPLLSFEDSLHTSPLDVRLRWKDPMHVSSAMDTEKYGIAVSTTGSLMRQSQPLTVDAPSAASLSVRSPHQKQELLLNKKRSLLPDQVDNAPLEHPPRKRACAQVSKARPQPALHAPAHLKAKEETRPRPHQVELSQPLPGLPGCAAAAIKQSGINSDVAIAIKVPCHSIEKADSALLPPRFRSPGKPLCKYGKACYQRNETHWRNFDHPHYPHCPAHQGSGLAEASQEVTGDAQSAFVALAAPMPSMEQLGSSGGADAASQRLKTAKQQKKANKAAKKLAKQERKQQKKANKAAKKLAKQRRMLGNQLDRVVHTVATAVSNLNAHDEKGKGKAQKKKKTRGVTAK
eukprot:CAMPEP_0119298832 /NCGR_PEP_ID=MMETSP1333-20130426/953_1 /TAXON_ID=418940 /ORGANISM="Scyphosphaera apsteinii, Strain RCC1455" /LENGTH=554 /DNA_ID=CAMNT_0007300037 /DNA_START=54 /DNA_END=1718 /DNA_ORIENTATION=+